jgi:hypothetical protein
MQRRAFETLDRYLFTASDLRLSPALLSKLGYSEWAGYGYVGYTGYGNLPQWAYNPPKRHDVPLAEQIARAQDRALAQIFQPLTLARLEAGASETSDAHPMTLTDLFSWMQTSVYREFTGGSRGRSIDGMRRTLQMHYLETLGQLYVKPKAGTPDEAQALARASLVAVAEAAERAGRSGGFDTATRAHVALLAARARGLVLSGDRRAVAGD